MQEKSIKTVSVLVVGLYYISRFFCFCFIKNRLYGDCYLFLLEDGQCHV